MQKLILLISCLLLNTSPAIAESIKHKARIMELLPNLPVPLLIEPAIPDLFTLVEYDEESHVYFWGRKEVFEVYLENPEAVIEPFIQVIKQNGMNPEEWKRVASKLKAHFPKGFQSSNFKWGVYSGISIKMMIGEDPQHIAQVYLNDKEGTVLIFRLVYPTKKLFGNGNKPSKFDLNFWNNFLKNTTAIR